MENNWVLHLSISPLSDGKTKEEIYMERFRFFSWLMSLIVSQLWNQKMRSWIHADEMSLYLNKLVFG